MKFAALALTLLLAVGSNGDAWPGDYLKTTVLPEVKVRALRVVEALTGTEYEGNINEIREKVEFAFGYVTTLLDSDEVKSTYASAKTHSDELVRKWEGSDMRNMLMKRKTEYETIFNDFYEKSKGPYEEMKLRLGEMMGRNHEETITTLKTALVTAFQELQGHMTTVREMFALYTHEYMEQLKQVADQAAGSDLRVTIPPKLIEIREKIVEIYDDILREINQQ